MHEEDLISIHNYESHIIKYLKQFGIDTIDSSELSKKIKSGITKDMSSFQMSRFASEVAASMAVNHSDYIKIASIILLKYHHAVTPNTFSDKIKQIHEYSKSIQPKVLELVENNAKLIDSFIDYSRDFNHSYFAIQTLLRSYLFQIDSKTIERPQDLFMRASIQMHHDDFDKVKETYDLISNGLYTHATPTLYNSCLKYPQLASCFIYPMLDDTISGIFDTISKSALISKHAGGIGLNVHNIRSEGSSLSKGGESKGLMPIFKILETVSDYINQGGNKRKSSMAIYLEPWHADIFYLIDLRKNSGPEELRARNLFTALWVNDLFMKRVERDENWTLFDPKMAKGLSDVYGDEFEKLYLEYEEKLDGKVIKAQNLWSKIIESQIETGTPYMLYKDACNKYSNHVHLGTIKSSNLCCEIIEYNSPDEFAVCNLASICLPKHVKGGSYDYVGLKEVVKTAVYNLNKVIDTSYYPTIECERSNFRHRPMAIGVQGLSDTFVELGFPFDSSEAAFVNKLIFETLYFGALEASIEIAKKEGAYSSFEGSFLSKGIFHWEMYNASVSNMWDWSKLREDLLKYGSRNSLLISLMPTAGTSQIFGNSECIEVPISNIYTRRTYAGDFQVVNEYLMKELIAINMWNKEIKNLIISLDGSIQSIPGIPQRIKNMYKTAWEIPMKVIINMAADRQAFIDQSQSLNLFLSSPTLSQVSSMHFYAWKKNLKTGMYYLRTKPLVTAIKFTVDNALANQTFTSLQEQEKANDENDNGYCESCTC